MGLFGKKKQAETCCGSCTLEAMARAEEGKEGRGIQVLGFYRFEMGEGLQKREDNFAEEVMGQMKK